MDCRKGFWQVPICPEDQHKTAFSPGPGMGLYEFCRMPFGLTGAPGTFQSLMDRVLRGLNNVIVYVDDILIFSPDKASHLQHIQAVLERIQEHGLTSHGDKCIIGCSEVSYLGHTFSKDGMSPDPSKISVISNWATPTSVSDVRRFLGLASYYRQYKRAFSSIAEPLHRLTDKGQPFIWDSNCQDAFIALKRCLMSAPILKSPNFDLEFTLFTDASDTGVGAVLQQGDQVVAYGSKSLNQAEKNYSVIEKECLALVYGVKQFRHYLLGKPFVIFTDHNPLQWLSSQKMQGRLSRWALSLQEYDFTIKYRKGSSNQNADALSRLPDESSTVTELVCGPSSEELKYSQQQDPMLHRIVEHLGRSSLPPKGSAWTSTRAKRWIQLWPQLVLQNEVLYRKICLPVSRVDSLVVVVPPTLHSQYLEQCHDTPTAGHQGYAKTLGKLRECAYWIGMAADVHRYYDSCDTCHESKLSLPTHVPMINTVKPLNLASIKFSVFCILTPLVE